MSTNCISVSDVWFQTAYFGPASCVVSHFEALGLNIAPNYNPADFIRELMLTHLILSIIIIM